MPAQKPCTILIVSIAPWRSVLAKHILDAAADKMEVWCHAYCHKFASEEIAANPPDDFMKELAAEGISLNEKSNLSDYLAECTTTRATLDDIDLVVALNGDDLKQFKLAFPQWQGEVESWSINGADDLAARIREHVSRLMVKLILKGGRRPVRPLESTEQVTTASPRNSSILPSQGKKSAKGNARVSLKSKGRGGKKVTVVSGLALTDDELQDLAKDLKQVCGAGGTVREGTIEIQGDKRTQIMNELQKRGFNSKRVGG